MTLPASRAPLPTVSKAVGRARLILHQEAQAVAQLADRLDESFCRAVDLIESCTGRVIVSGMGKAGLIGRKIAATFTSTGTGSHFLHPAEAVHGDLGCVWPEDLLLILSHSGRSEEIVRLLPWINQRHIPLIGVTGCQESPLAQASSVLLHLGSIVEAGSLQLAPTSSTTAMLALGDALALVVSERRGFAAEDFARYHPAGSLGRKLANVEDLMRPAAQCRIAHADRSVRDVLVRVSRPGRRSGAILLIDQRERLCGIFTDSDLAKLLEQGDEQAMRLPMHSVMSSSPTTVPKGTKIQEAVRLLVERKISELPVVDAHGKPLGLIDITDVVELLPTGSAVTDRIDPANDSDRSDHSRADILPIRQRRANQDRNLP